MDKKKIAWKLNLFDTGVLVVVVLIGAALVWRVAAGKLEQKKEFITIRYEVELESMSEGTAELVEVGDELVERVRKQSMGIVESVELNPTRFLSKDQITGNYFFAEVPEQYTATMMVTSKASVHDNRIELESGLEIRAGRLVYVYGPNYYGVGYVTRIERE